MFPALAIAAVAIGTGIGAKGELDAAAAESDAARKDAALKRIQAAETEKRAKMNMQITDEEGDVLEGEMVSAYAKGGVDVGSGSPLMALAEQGYRTRREMANLYSEAKFRADMLRAGAEDQELWASRNTSAAQTRVIGNLFKTAGKMGMDGAFGGGEKPKSGRMSVDYGDAEGGVITGSSRSTGSKTYRAYRGSR